MKPQSCARLAGCVLAALTIPACGGAPAPAPASAGAGAQKAADPDADSPSGPTKRFRLKLAPYSIALPEGATLEQDDGPVPSDVVRFDGGGAPLTIGPRGSVSFMPLDASLKDLARQRMKVVFTAGSGDSYVIVYQPFKDNSTLEYIRYFTIDGQNMQCEASGIFEASIPEYDAACRSIRK